MLSSRFNTLYGKVQEVLTLLCRPVKEGKKTHGEAGLTVSLCRAPGAFTHISCFTLVSV